MNHFTKSQAAEAAQRISDGASPDDLAHLVGDGDNAYVSTPLTVDEYAKGGYTTRYFSLREISAPATRNVTSEMKAIAAKLWANETAMRKLRCLSLDLNWYDSPPSKTSYFLFRLKILRVKLYAELVACDPSSFTDYEKLCPANLESWHQRELGL